MAKKISIHSSPVEVEKDVSETVQERGTRQILGDILDGKLPDSWKDLELIISEIFNSSVMAKIYLYLVRYPGRSMDELNEKLEYSKQQIARYANKLSLLGYISGDKKKGDETVFFAQPPEMVIKKFARSVEQKMQVLSNIDTILLKKAKELTLRPLRALMRDEQESGKG
jgi:hypothetical protein